MNYQMKLITAPTIEPLDLQDVRAHLKLDTVEPGSYTTSAISLEPKSHSISSGFAGTSVDVQGLVSKCVLISGELASGASIACKLQDSEDNTTWADVTSGAFPTITSANDIQTHELSYSSRRRYVRAYAVVAGASSPFSVVVIKYNPEGSEDEQLQSWIKAARQYVERYQRRALLTQTWEMYLDYFPSSDLDPIRIPKPPVQSITSIKYTDVNGVLQTWSSSKYQTDVIGEPGRILPVYGESWPTDVKSETMNAVVVKFICGHTAADLVPDDTKTAMRLLIGTWWENRASANQSKMSLEITHGVDPILGLNRFMEL